MFKRKAKQLLTGKDKAKLECMVRTEGKLYTLEKIGGMSLLDRDTEKAAVEYIKSL